MKCGNCAMHFLFGEYSLYLSETMCRLSRLGCHDHPLRPATKRQQQQNRRAYMQAFRIKRGDQK